MITKRIKSRPIWSERLMLVRPIESHNIIRFKFKRMIILSVSKRKRFKCSKEEWKLKERVLLSLDNEIKTHTVWSSSCKPQTYKIKYFS